MKLKRKEPEDANLARIGNPVTREFELEPPVARTPLESTVPALGVCPMGVSAEGHTETHIPRRVRDYSPNWKLPNRPSTI